MLNFSFVRKYVPYYITFLVIVDPDGVADVDGVQSTSDGEMHVS